MKLKPYKEKIPVINTVKDICSKIDASSATDITIDVDGGITLENFKRIVDYQSDRLVIETKQKKVYIYGEELTIASCDKHFATAIGNIKKIEIFSKDV